MPRGTRSGQAAGTTSCPWLIRARLGQRVNLTLFNLDRQQSALSVSADASVTNGVLRVAWRGMGVARRGRENPHSIIIIIII